MKTQITNYVNGINVTALRETIEQIQSDSNNGQTTWSVKSQWQGGTRSDHIVDGVDIGGQKIDRSFKIQIDEPHELCGSNQFANPQEYLLAATNACMMVGYTAVAALMGIRLSKLELEMEGDIDLRGFLGIADDVAPGYESLRYRVRIAGDGTAEQFEEMHAVVQKTSPNFYNISNPIAMTSELVVD